MAHVVLDLNDLRPIFGRPEWLGDQVRAVLPAGWSLAVLDTPAEGTGDGSSAAHPQVLAEVADARVYMGFGISPDVLTAGPALGWVHTGSAGVGSSLTPELRSRDLVFTNSAGIHGPPMAEAVLGMILHFSRGFDLAVRSQARATWDTAPFYASDSPLREISGSTVGILGLGGIGREVADRVRPLGARILGLKRTPGGVPEGVEGVFGEEGFHRLLEESDFVVVTAPDTPATRGMMDRKAFGRMKPGAVFVNVARGKIADEDALVDALRTGRLRGAGLDVFAREPLAPDHPLWTLDNVLITPHVSPVTDRFWRREADLILHNLEAFLAGKPEEMRNVVDIEAGY
jgi:phosphoglycerate dehydrogenase-like enzyme